MIVRRSVQHGSLRRLARTSRSPPGSSRDGIRAGSCCSLHASSPCPEGDPTASRRGGMRLHSPRMPCRPSAPGTTQPSLVDGPSASVISSLVYAARTRRRTPSYTTCTTLGAREETDGTRRVATSVGTGRTASSCCQYGHRVGWRAPSEKPVVVGRPFVPGDGCAAGSRARRS